MLISVAAGKQEEDRDHRPAGQMEEDSDFRAAGGPPVSQAQQFFDKRLILRSSVIVLPVNTNITGGVTWTPHQGSSNPARTEKRARGHSPKRQRPSQFDDPHNGETTCLPATATNSSQGQAMAMVEEGRGPPGFRPPWAPRTISQNSSRGLCRDGDQCTYSHNSSGLSPEAGAVQVLPAQVLQEGLACMHLHGSTPARHFTR